MGQMYKTKTNWLKTFVVAVKFGGASMELCGAQGGCHTIDFSRAATETWRSLNLDDFDDADCLGDASSSALMGLMSELCDALEYTIRTESRSEAWNGPPLA